MKPKKILEKIKKLLMDSLKQGISPEKLAVTVILGVMLGLFPIIGITSMLCVLAAMSFRLNHVFIQLVNYLVYPLQLVSIIPFLRLSHDIFPLANVKEINFSLIETFSNANLTLVISEFGLILLSGIILWTLIALPVSGVLYPVFLKTFRKYQTK